MPVQQMQDNMSNNMQMTPQQQDFKMAEVSLSETLRLLKAQARLICISCRYA